MTEKKKGMLGRFYGETHKEFESREQEYKRREGELLDAFKRLEENKASMSPKDYITTCQGIQDELDKLDDKFLSAEDNLARYYVRLVDLYETVEKRLEYRISVLEAEVIALKEKLDNSN